jgi:hypothetical protein
LHEILFPSQAIDTKR